MKKTDAIKNFLIAKTWPDLAALYNHNLEVQVNVLKGNGILNERINKFDKKVREWSDGIQTWKNFRIPINANTNPEYIDYDLKFSLEEHCEGIGMTGWDWVNKRSLWVAYDFDAITGHSDKHSKKLTDIQLKEIRETIEKIPFATLRLSTSGKGLHLYVFLSNIETANHTEHSAVGRSILSLMSGMVGFDFTTKVDVAGSNMWVWHRKMIGTDGLKLLKQGTILDKVPANWREHINVITRKSNKTIPQFIVESNESIDIFEELTNQRTRVPLDTEHKKLINWLSNNNCVWWWDQDCWMLVTHTIHLKEAHAQLGLRGKFDTISNHGSDQNVFGYPLREGAWSLRRYTRGVAEHTTWEQDGKNWTTCIYNRPTDIQIAAKLHKGVEHQQGGYVFRDTNSAIAALKDIGIEISVPPYLNSKQTKIKRLKRENKIVVSICDVDGSDAEKAAMPDWLLEKKCWVRVFKYNFPADSEIELRQNYDDVLRHIYDESDSDAGWLMLREKGWCSEPLVHVKTFLKSLDNDDKDLDLILGKSIINAWKIVCKPFAAEYPGNREWNRRAAQFAVPPSTDIDNLSFPTWQKVLSHCGEELNEIVKENAWCKENAILNGSDYLTLWISSLIKHPERPSPYLGFYGEQDCGKSIFHEMLELIIVNGIERCDVALSSSSGFNGELENTIVCVIEETNLNKNKIASNRVKDWVTSPKIMIHIKNSTPYSVTNYCHFIQCANDLEEFPVSTGDTRMTLIKVNRLKDKIGKETLKTALKKEASDFLAHLLNIEIPEFNDRLAIPVLITEGKIEAEAKNMSALEKFILEECYSIDGHSVSSIEFYEKFTTWLPANEIANWGRTFVGMKLPNKFPKGKDTKTMLQMYGNITFDSEAKPGNPCRKVGQFLKKE